MSPKAMELLPKTITRPVGRLGAAAQNALEVARFGGLETDEEPSPFEVVAEQRVYRLRRYYPDATQRPARRSLLVPPLMLAAEVYDVSPSTSAVTILREHGADPWVVDFGAPEHEEGGLERTLADHVLAVSDAVDRVRASDRPATSTSAATRRAGCSATRPPPTGAARGSTRVITFGSPVDTRARAAARDPRAGRGRARPACSPTASSGGMALPAWASRTGFRLLDPVKSLRQPARLHPASSTTARRCCRARASAAS